MLILKRNVGEKIVISIAGEIVATVCVNETRGPWARLGIEAPAHVTIHREEVYNEINGRTPEAVSNAR